MIADEVAPYVYSDVTLGVYLDANAGNFTKTAGVIWREKSATYAKAVDITEAGSSRKMSDMFNNALAMAKWYESQNTPVVPTVVASTHTRRIVRR
jgi:hypothetical protein